MLIGQAARVGIAASALLSAGNGGGGEPGVPHRYWRVYISQNNGDVERTGIAELEMHTSIDGADVCVDGIPISSSYENGGTLASNAFDGSTSTAWLSAARGLSPTWLGYDFGEGNEQAIVEFSIQAGTWSASRFPYAFQLEYSDDEVDWFPVGMVEGETGWTSGDKRTFNASNWREPARAVSMLSVYIILKETSA